MRDVSREHTPRITASVTTNKSGMARAYHLYVNLTFIQDPYVPRSPTGMTTLHFPRLSLTFPMSSTTKKPNHENSFYTLDGKQAYDRLLREVQAGELDEYWLQEEHALRLIEDLEHKIVDEKTYETAIALVKDGWLNDYISLLKTATSLNK